MIPRETTCKEIKCVLIRNTSKVPGNYSEPFKSRQEQNVQNKRAVFIFLRKSSNSKQKDLVVCCFCVFLYFVFDGLLYNMFNDYLVRYLFTKPDKGSGVVMMDKPEYIRLVSAASVDNTPKLSHVDHKRPAKMRGRPPKHFRPLLQKEKELQENLRQILPEEIANSLSPKSSRLTHLYGLPKTHKATLG